MIQIPTAYISPGGIVPSNPHISKIPYIEPVIFSIPSAFGISRRSKTMGLSITVSFCPKDILYQGPIWQSKGITP